MNTIPPFVKVLLNSIRTKFSTAKLDNIERDGAWDAEHSKSYGQGVGVAFCYGVSSQSLRSMLPHYLVLFACR